MQRQTRSIPSENPFELQEAGAIAGETTREFSPRLEPLFESDGSGLSEGRFVDDLIDGMMAFSGWGTGIIRDSMGKTERSRILRQFAYGFAHGVCLVAYEPEMVDAMPVLDIDEHELRMGFPTPEAYDSLRKWISYRTLDIRALAVVTETVTDMRGDSRLPEIVSESLWSGLACGIAEGVSFATNTGVSQDGKIAYECPWESMAFVSMSSDTNPAPSTPTGRFMREMRLAGTDPTEDWGR